MIYYFHAQGHVIEIKVAEMPPDYFFLEKAKFKGRKTNDRWVSFNQLVQSTDKSKEQAEKDKNKSTIFETYLKLEMQRQGFKFIRKK